MMSLLKILALALILSCGMGCGSSSSSLNDPLVVDEPPVEAVGSGFKVTGTLSSIASSISNKGALKVGDASSVTNVVAVNPSTGSVTCTVAEVDSDTGNFTFWLTRRRSWLIYFINMQRRGYEMYMARYRSSTMDTLTPTSDAESTDLGSVTIDSETEIATSDEVESTDLVSDLGLDAGAAETIAGQDEFATRYTNPDMDDDGQVDCGDADSSDGAGSSKYMLDFHVRFDMKENGTNIAVSDLIDSFPDSSTTTASYVNTGIYVSYLNTFSSATSGTVTFSNSNVITEEDGAAAAGTAISEVTENPSGSYNGFGPNITDDSELPSGEYKFSFGDKTLTYSNVQVPTLAQLNAPTGRIFPFVKFNRTDSGCSANCTLSGVSYKWMKKTADGWGLASLAEVGVIVTESDTATTNSGAYLGFRIDGDENKTVGFVLPASSAEGSIDWDSANAILAGVTAAEFEAVTTTQICHVGLSYDDKLGMRYFENIQNALGTCAGDN